MVYTMPRTWRSGGGPRMQCRWRVPTNVPLSTFITGCGIFIGRLERCGFCRQSSARTHRQSALTRLIQWHGVVGTDTLFPSPPAHPLAKVSLPQKSIIYTTENSGPNAAMPFYVGETKASSSSV